MRRTTGTTARAAEVVLTQPHLLELVFLAIPPTARAGLFRALSGTSRRISRSVGSMRGPRSFMVRLPQLFDSTSSRADCAAHLAFARRHGAVVVLKIHRSSIPLRQELRAFRSFVLDGSWDRAALEHSGVLDSARRLEIAIYESASLPPLREVESLTIRCCPDLCNVSNAQTVHRCVRLYGCYELANIEPIARARRLILHNIARKNLGVIYGSLRDLRLGDDFTHSRELCHRLWIDGVCLFPSAQFA